ncbi:hypothetical protein NCG89_08475 [Spongiibacter taiwanensis]|uniref:hypothetical protein n=1 Tax=Spongiibacter taiwanensis TaxID=1748242 RepID=UPI002034DCAE|nr:hypothetical protein [Spongiibacter taiwanensis]USA44783.1 hypothetical protein NCG89_08475 [Spongiibacter taiwanensis]
MTDTEGSSTAPPDVAADAAAEAWRADMLAMLDAHFIAARERVDEAYHHHFASLGSVLKRHWQHRRDVPADLLTLPRGLWQVLSGRRGPRPLTGKEQAVAEIMAREVLDLPGLQQKLLFHLEGHPDYRPDAIAQLQAELAPYDADEALRRLHLAVAQWGQRHDNSREFLMFLGLGLLGRSLSDKIAFGSASVLGVSLASSAYLSQQGALSALWASWFGVPGWVAVSGAIGGFAVAIAATPLISPFLEYGFNRWGTRRRLLQMVDAVHREIRAPLGDRLWRVGAYLQFIPDLVQVLRMLR